MSKRISHFFKEEEKTVAGVVAVESQTKTSEKTSRASMAVKLNKKPKRFTAIEIINHMEELFKTKNIVHVIPTNDRWAVKKGGTERAASVYATKDEALAGASKLKYAPDIVIHDNSGKIINIECKVRSCKANVKIATSKGKVR